VSTESAYEKFRVVAGSPAMTSIRSTTHAASRHLSHASAPTLRKVALPASISAAAKDLLKRSEGNDVSVASFKASPAQLQAFAKDAGALKNFLYKTGMHISKEVPTSNYQEHSVKKFGGGHFSKAIYDFAQVPGSIPMTDETRANQAAALKD